MNHHHQKSPRTIFHIDMDAFFASVEEAENPTLKGKAVIIGGQPGQRGVVSTCSYEARRFGVHSAMSLTEAGKRCPHAIFLQGNHALYREYSNQIMQIFLAATPYVEVVSIDEAYLDVTDVFQLYDGAIALAELLKKIILMQTKLTCSVGIASNKLLAKIASSTYKPNGLLAVPEGEEAQFLAPLPISTIPGIGKKTALRMEADGFFDIHQLQAAGIDLLMRLYGNWGYQCHQSAMGFDNREVQWEESSCKSIGAETTYAENQIDFIILKETLEALCQKVWTRLKRYRMRARGLSIKLRSETFHTITRSYTFDSHVNDLEEISRAATVLLENNYANELPLRLIGISLEKLTDTYWQPTFWSDISQ
ncbi:MAG: DNA polymerase IV [Parachlamydiaceae bacterium]|nr:DNA polymerase IV [Parachlamydiaceae bacterium]